MAQFRKVTSVGDIEVSTVKLPQGIGPLGSYETALFGPERTCKVVGHEFSEVNAEGMHKAIVASLEFAIGAKPKEMYKEPA